MKAYPIYCQNEECGTGVAVVELPDDAPQEQIDHATSGYECGKHDAETSVSITE